MSTLAPHPQPDHDHHVMTISLSARLDGADAKPLTPARFWETYAHLGGDLSDASSSDEEHLVRLANRGAAAALHAAEIESQGITLLTPFHPQYPSKFIERLGTNAPPLLYVAGDADVLGSAERQRLAIVGSRDASDAELDSARQAAEAAAAHGWDVVSGGAKGVDAVALNTAASGGTTVVAFLTEGVRRAVRKGALRRLVSSGQAVIASPVHPDAGFTVGNAMARNKLIYALADMTYVAAVVEGEGGTWQGATEALRRAYGPVAVNLAAAGSGALGDAGARVVSTIDELFMPVAAPDPSPEQQVTQESLFQ